MKYPFQVLESWVFTGHRPEHGSILAQKKNTGDMLTESSFFG
jgi:hypothetical protein